MPISPKKLAARRALKKELHEVAGILDQLSIFPEWKEILLPEIRDDLRAGKTAHQIREKYLSHLVARQISIGLTSPDMKTALSAIKDVQDREEGKAVERREVRHMLEQLPNEELDAILLTKLSDLESDTKSEPSPLGDKLH